MKKTLKRVLASLIAVIMAFSSMPITTFAANKTSGTVPFDASGVFKYNANADRLNTSLSEGYYNVCNDGSDSNFTMAFFKYDVSNIRKAGITVTSAKFGIQLRGTPGSDCQGLTFSYTTNDKADSFTNGYVNSTDPLIFGRNDAHLAGATSYFGLQNIQSFAYDSATWKTGYTFTVNIAGAINAAVAQGRDYAVIMIHQTTYGGRDQAGKNGGTNSWTDTKLRYGPVTVAYDGTTNNSVYKIKEVSKVGVIDGTNGSRLDKTGQTMNIVNDSQDGNFSIGFWQYDISQLLEMNAYTKTAQLVLDIPSTPESECQGLTFYYALDPVAEGLVDGANSQPAVMGTAGGHIQKAISYYNLVSFATVAKEKIVVGNKISLDVSSAINHTLSNNSSVLTIMVMQSQAGSTGQTNGWTDTRLSYGKNPLTCTIDINVPTFEAGVESLNAAITSYENKMRNIGSSTATLYRNMANAYEAYIKALRYRDAYVYGKNTSAYNAMQTVTSDLIKATSLMIPWTDEVTGQYESKVPVFHNDSSTDMAGYTDFYGNVLYTETCSSGNYDKTNGHTDGASVLFQPRIDVSINVQLYYPNTVLVYDGSSNKAVIPVVLMEKRTTTDNRYTYTVYPAAEGCDSTYTSTMAGIDSDLISLSTAKGDGAYDFRGGRTGNVLSFTSARANNTDLIGTTVGNPYKRAAQPYSDIFGSWWNCYATAFQVSDNIKFNGEGVKEVGKYWAWYGGSDAGLCQSIDANMRDYKPSQHKIYVVNYKELADKMKDATNLSKLMSISNYTEGGMLDALKGYDLATSFDLSSITLANVEEKGEQIKAAIQGMSSAITEDKNLRAYPELRSAVESAKKIFDQGNKNNENYTAESWSTFVTAYANATEHFAILSANPYDTEAAFALIEPLKTAQNNLVLNKEVVDTTLLQYAIDNADAVVDNANYFVSGTIPANLAAVIQQAKTDIWTSEAYYGLDAKKIVKTEENQAKVDSYVNQFIELLKDVIIDTSSIVATYNYSLDSAITEAAKYESKKDNYSNYATLQTAVNNAVAYKEALPKINAKIEGQAANLINNYINYVDAIGYAIATLRPAFKLVANGTIANPGTETTTRIYSSSRPNNFNFYWKHTTDIVYFKTTRDALTVKLPKSEWGAYCKQTASNFDLVLDSINIHSQDVSTGELTSAYTTGWGDISGYGLSATQKTEHPGVLSVNSSNLEIALNNFKVTNSTGQAYGVDKNGANVTNANYDFTEELGSTEGTDPRSGGIYALNGTTVFNSNVVITAPVTSGAPNLDNITSAKSNQLDLASTNTEVGVLYYWRYAETLVNSWAGYGYDKTPLSLKIGVVDLSTLFDLISECEDPTFTATANNYTTASWNAFLNALQLANDDMNYSTMSYEDIVNECDRRYTNLYNARENLQAPASNAKLKEAVLAAKSAYENDQQRIKPETWTEFETAYEAALSKYQGIYSDTGVRDYPQSEQATIDAFATALTAAMSKLAYLVDFSPVDNAVSALVTSIENNKYTSASMQALTQAINNLTYYKMSVYDRSQHYDDETDFVAALNQEATVTIPGLKALLEQGTYTTEIIDALKVARRTSFSDPDAYDQDVIDNALNSLQAFENVSVLNRQISCYKYKSQEEVDADIASALSAINLKQYQVTLNGEAYGTFDYGTQITVPSPTNADIDWYYAASSTTSSTAKKYLTTTDSLTFIVKGNTDLTTKRASQTETVKVSYVNGRSMAITDVQFVEPGTTITVHCDNAQKIPFYSCNGFTVNGTPYADGDSVTVNENTMIVYTYVLVKSTSYSVYVADIAYGYSEGDVLINDLSYNDEVSFIGEKYGNDDMAYSVNGVETVIEGNGRLVNDGQPPVYAWVEVDTSDVEAWRTAAGKGEIRDSNGDFQAAASDTNGRVVAYGPDYTFRVYKDTTLLALDEQAYRNAVELGIVTAPGDENGAKVDTSDTLIITQGVKFAFISTFTLPDNCSMVESGLLFAANKNSSEIPTVDLTLANADKNGIKRVKSTSHTAGNQYVVSVNSPSLIGKTVGDVGIKWVAYLVYTDPSGNLITVYSDPKTPSNLTDEF